MWHYLPHLHKNPVCLCPRPVLIRCKKWTRQCQTTTMHQHIYNNLLHKCWKYNNLSKLLRLSLPITYFNSIKPICLLISPRYTWFSKGIGQNIWAFLKQVFTNTANKCILQRKRQRPGYIDILEGCQWHWVADHKTQCLYQCVSHICNINPSPDINMTTTKIH